MVFVSILYPNTPLYEDDPIKVDIFTVSHLIRVDDGSVVVRQSVVTIDTILVLAAAEKKLFAHVELDARGIHAAFLPVPLMTHAGVAALHESEHLLVVVSLGEAKTFGDGHVLAGFVEEIVRLIAFRPVPAGAAEVIFTNVVPLATILRARTSSDIV